MGNLADGQQLQLFRPSSINLNEPADRWQFVASLTVEGCTYYLTPAGRWSTDLQAAEAFSSPYAAQSIAQSTLPQDGTRWNPLVYSIKTPAVRRGLVVMS